VVGNGGGPDRRLHAADALIWTRRDLTSRHRRSRRLGGGAAAGTTADLPHAWDFRTPSGGVLMTVAMRAMQAELDDPALRPISANTHFCSPVPAGPLEVRVEVLRRGNVAAQVRAALSSTTMPGPGSR
jgi:acyl-coenzyme A thioesterase PaaI-like protein